MQKMGILVKDMKVTKLPLSKYDKEKYLSRSKKYKKNDFSIIVINIELHWIYLIAEPIGWIFHKNSQSI